MSTIRCSSSQVAPSDGSDLRYGTAEHPLVGRLVPEPVPARVAQLLRAARPVLLDLAGRTDIVAAAQGWSDRVEIVSAPHPDAPADALLIRTDGYVAGAVGAGEPAASMHTALTTWFGELKPVATPA